MEKKKKKPVRKHESLIAWQLCSQLRRLVLRYIRSGPASKDYDYRGQLRRAARSACYNTSEGFYRYKHGEFGHLLNVARGSLGEALDQIDEGGENKYFTKEQQTEMRRMCIRAMKANVALRASWTSEAPDGLKKTAAAAGQQPTDANLGESPAAQASDPINPERETMKRGIMGHRHL